MNTLRSREIGKRMKMADVTFAIIGFGGRGTEFSDLAALPEMQAKVVAVAEPDPVRRELAVRKWHLPPERTFASAEALLAQPRLADAVINATQDRLHVKTAIPVLAKGYHMLLEKPMAVNPEDCRAITQAAEKAGTVVSVCHSLRYHAVYDKVAKLLAAGMIGEVVSFDHLEGVNDVHQTSSFVRGPWRNEAEATFMLMSKSCHDLDLFQQLFRRRCERVSSFGSLTYFRQENAPAGAPAYCHDGCPAELACPYHCSKIYFDKNGWRSFIFIGDDDATVAAKLRNGPYGRCVFHCDNDVVDHQVVALEYAGGLTGTFTMTAFHPGGRFTRIHGTKGYLEADLSGAVSIWDFTTGNKDVIAIPVETGRHGGGDYLVFRDFLAAVRKNDPTAVRTTPAESLESHAVVFAAERSRRLKRLVEVDELRA